VRLDTEAEFRLDADVDEVRVLPVRVECEVRTDACPTAPGAPAAPAERACGTAAAGAAAVPQVSQ
jgi:hypothetical protein